MSLQKNTSRTVQSDTSAETLAMDKQIYTKHAVYKGQMVALKKLQIDKPKIELTRKMLLELKRVSTLEDKKKNERETLTDERPEPRAHLSLRRRLH